jgi:hypothetical protein
MVSQDWKTHRSHRIFTKTEKAVFARKPNLVSVKIESSYSKKINFTSLLMSFLGFQNQQSVFFLVFKTRTILDFQSLMVIYFSICNIKFLLNYVLSR